MMENYIVRIYRRGVSGPEELAGVCESVERETRYTFNTLETLMALLAPTGDLRRTRGDRISPAKPVVARISDKLKAY
jgi:hypothetical protein